MKKTIVVLLLAIMVMVIFVPVVLAADGSATEASVGTIDTLVAVVLMALVIEKIAETVKAGISPAKPPGWVWFIITAGFGVAGCILFQVNMFLAIGLSSFTPASYIFGQVITGIGVGSGSNFVHDLIDRIKSY